MSAAASTGAPPWLAAFRAGHLRLVLALAGLALAAAPFLWGLGWPSLAAGAAVVVLLGVPHGALDHKIAAPWLRPPLGRAWFPAFALAYLGLAGVVLASWLLAPAASLLGFLGLSVLHFGLEDARDRRDGAAEVLARGGLPVAVPVLADPEGAGRFFDALAGTGGDMPGAVRLAALLWLAPAAAFALRAARRPDARPDLLEAGALCAVLAALPALAGFAFYFVAVHAPRHTAELAARRAPDDPAAGWSWALLQSLPLTLATCALGAILYAAGPGGSADERLLRTLFWGLAALTVPHMLLVWLDERLGRGGRLG